MARSSPSRRFDLIGLLDAAGRRSARWANRHLERGPVRVPLLLLALGTAALVVAWALGSVSGGTDAGASVENEGLVVASILYGVGGVCALVGLVGLLSALIVHIVQKRGRQP